MVRFDNWTRVLCTGERCVY